MRIVCVCVYYMCLNDEYCWCGGVTCIRVAVAGAGAGTGGGEKACWLLVVCAKGGKSIRVCILYAARAQNAHILSGRRGWGERGDRF